MIQQKFSFDTKVTITYQHWRMKHILAALIVLALLSVSGMFAETTQNLSPQEAEKLVKTAQEVITSAKTIKTVEITEDEDSIITITSYKKSNPDGTMFSRIERNTKPKTNQNDTTKNVLHKSSVMITNAEGQWDLRSNVAIHMVFIGDLQKKVAMLTQTNRAKDADNVANKLIYTYNIEDYLLREKPCYKIKKKLDDSSYALLLDRVKKNHAAIVDLVQKSSDSDDATGNKLDTDQQEENTIPYITEFLIGKNTNIIWAKNEYAKGGDLIDGKIYSDVEVNEQVSDDLFKVSPSMKTCEAKTILEYIKIKQNEREKNEKN